MDEDLERLRRDSEAMRRLAFNMRDATTQLILLSLALREQQAETEEMPSGEIAEAAVARAMRR